MKKLAGLVMVLIALLASGCMPVMAGNRLVGSGHPVSRDYQLSGFTAVDVNNAFRVTLSRGDSYNVTVTTDDNFMEYVVVRKDGGTLRLGMEMGRVTSYTSRIREAHITMPALTGVRLNGASQVTMNGFGREDTFTADLDGASKLTGQLQANSINLTANGASRYGLEGDGKTLQLRCDGASNADLGNLVLVSATVRLNGASQATLNSKTSLDYDLDGASQLRYRGSPALGLARAGGASRAIRQ